jgi:hypothetical protein
MMAAKHNPMEIEAIEIEATENGETYEKKMLSTIDKFMAI